MSSSPLTADALPRDERLVSLDALRGFDMLWIIGGSTIIAEAANATGWRWLSVFKKQFEHTFWNGFTPYDLIFPLFLFIAGVAMPFSFEKRLARGETKSSLARHVIIRGLLLVLFGIVYNNGWHMFNLATMRYPSVLGRIGLAYLFAGLIVINFGVRGQIAWMIGLIVSYWAAMKFIPVPGFGPGDLAPGHNLADYLDGKLLPGVLLHPDPRHPNVLDNVRRDPEGILSTVPAISTALSGAVTGWFLKHSRYSGYMKTLLMCAAGLVCLGLARLWNLDFPINKNLWSSAFVVYCAGWSLLLLAAFYLVADVWRLRGWTLFFVVIGSNSILIYMAQRFIPFDYAANYLIVSLFKYTSVAYAALLAAVIALSTKWALMYVLYRKRIFLRV